MNGPLRPYLFRHPGVVRLAVIVLILIAWEIAARWFIDPLFISPPSKVFASLGGLMNSGSMNQIGRAHV